MGISAKPRKHEKIGGGHFVFRRGKKTGRVSTAKTLPFEHPTAGAAEREAERLAEKHPGERFVVFSQTFETQVAPETT